MKLTFESDLQYQQDAIQSITALIGNYNPDWAVVFEDDKKIYFVAETKDTGTDQVDLSKLKVDEQLKIKCGKAHFNEFEDLEYKVVNKVGQLIE